MRRPHTCGEARASLAGKDVTLAGWVHTRRDHGELTFIDLRDRYGITQVVAHAKENPAAHRALGKARNEWVLRVRGTVRPRPEGTKNPKLPTGEVEVAAAEIEVLNESKTPPFYVNEETEVEETLRWKYRYVDLRRERSRDLMRLRHEVVDFIRRFMVERGFWEIETTDLIRSDPTGARDLVVTSRYYPGKFWALPQSPQQLKQILMVGGLDRYFQIARCFRDEDPRADRTLEHSQLDIEMSFVEKADVMALGEELYTAIFQKFARKPLKQVPWPRLTFEEAIRRFGIDRPDLRFGMELVDLTDTFRSSSFKVFRETIDQKGVVRGIVVPGKAKATRKEIDEWTAIAKRKGAKGLAQFALTEGTIDSQVAKFLSPEELAGIPRVTGAKDGDVVLAGADTYLVASESLGGLLAQMGVSKAEAQERFGALLDALDYGAPPHGGIAPGVDRLIMTLAGTENIREVQAFPKTQTGYDPLLDAPATVDLKLLEELGLRVVAKPERPG